MLLSLTALLVGFGSSVVREIGSAMVSIFVVGGSSSKKELCVLYNTRTKHVLEFWQTREVASRYVFIVHGMNRG